MLYINYKNGAFSLESRKDSSVVSLLPAILVKDGNEICGKAQANGNTVTTDFDGLSVCDTYFDEGNGLFKVVRVITNSGDKAVFKDIFEVKTEYTPTRYLIPAVNYNGNDFSPKNTVTGLTYEGEPWVLAYDRMGIPSCTLCENKEYGTALFASDCDAASLRSACSLIKKDDGAFVQRIFHPVTEAPVSYTNKRILTERYDEYTTLENGESVTEVMYVFACVPMYENYAAANLLDRAADVFDLSLKECLSAKQVWDLGISFAKALLYDYKGHKMIITHFAPRLFRSQHGAAVTGEEMAKRLSDPYYTELGRFDERFEIGWADQGLLNARMIAVDAHEKGDKEMFDIAVGIFDSWAEKQQENGLIRTQFQHYYGDASYEIPDPDVCNLGWGAAEMARMYTYLKSLGIDKPEYKEFAVRIADFFCNNYSDEYGFGKAWTMEGECSVKLGTIGGFMMLGILETYLITGNKLYLDTAIKASDFYYARDLDNFTCTAGALDCMSIDKETAYPFINGSLIMYEVTKDKKYLERAKKAAYFFFSWGFHYDCLYPEESEFTQFGYHTKGGTAISVEHHAIDSWGSAAVPGFLMLAKYTGDKRWEKRAQIMWANAIQGITHYEGQKTHGQVRPLGGQNEGFFHCRWTKYRPTCEDRGHFNDCLPGWVSAYRMMTIYDNATKEKVHKGFLDK